MDADEANQPGEDEPSFWGSFWAKRHSEMARPATRDDMLAVRCCLALIGLGVFLILGILVVALLIFLGQSGLLQ